MSTQKPLISFDYAIKFLLKHKKDYGIVEGFISDLLKAIGYPPVKIVTLLDSESNKEDPKYKRSLADVIVEDADHKHYIIEIERQLTEDFIHKACFNTSRLIIDSIPEGNEYTNITKVFHISLLYFPLGNAGPIYHGDNGIYELDTKERLVYHVQDPHTNIITDVTTVLPEYLFISIPMFQDKLQREIDDWLYVMKYDEVPPKEFHSAYMEQVAERLSLLKMKPQELAAYNAYRKELLRDSSELRAAMNQGRVEEKVEIAKNMLADQEPLEKIMKWTGLSQEAIQGLQQGQN